MSKISDFLDKNKELWPYATAGAAIPAVTFALLRAKKLSDVVSDYNKDPVEELKHVLEAEGVDLPQNNLQLGAINAAGSATGDLKEPQNPTFDAKILQNYPQFYPKSFS